MRYGFSRNLPRVAIRLALMAIVMPSLAMAESIDAERVETIASESGWAMPLPLKASAQDLYFQGMPQQQVPQSLPKFHARMLAQLRLQAQVDQTRQLPEQLVPVWFQLAQPAKILF